MSDLQVTFAEWSALDEATAKALWPWVQSPDGWCRGFWRSVAAAEAALPSKPPGSRVIVPRHMSPTPEFGSLLVVRPGTSLRAARLEWNGVRGAGGVSYWEEYDAPPGVYETVSTGGRWTLDARVLRSRVALPLARAIVARTNPLLVDAFEAATLGL